MSKPIVAVLTPEAKDFLKALEKGTRQEFGASIRKLQNGETVHNFKKLLNTDGIYEFSVIGPHHTYRLFAFWDTRSATATLIVCTHGLDKKTQKTPPQEIKKAEQLKEKHFATYSQQSTTRWPPTPFPIKTRHCNSSPSTTSKTSYSAHPAPPSAPNTKTG